MAGIVSTSRKGTQSMLSYDSRGQFEPCNTQSVSTVGAASGATSSIRRGVAMSVAYRMSTSDPHLCMPSHSAKMEGINCRQSWSTARVQSADRK